MGGLIPSLTECTPMKARRFPIGPKTSCLARARTHQGRQRTQTFSRPTVEYLGLDDQTIDAIVRSSLLRNGRRGPVRESFRAERSAACRTAMISGPRYGSTSELQRAADATRSRARRQYTSPVTLFPRTGAENVNTSEARPRQIPHNVFSWREYLSRPGVIQSEARKRARGVVRKRWQVPPRFWRSGLRHHSRARGPAIMASTNSRPPRGPQKIVPQHLLEPRTAVPRPKGMFAFVDDMIVEVLLAQFRPFSVCPTCA
jgi:hypothetical protein